MIKKVEGGYQVVSSKGKNLGGPYKSLVSAKITSATGRVFQASQRLIEGGTGAEIRKRRLNHEIFYESGSEQLGQEDTESCE